MSLSIIDRVLGPGYGDVATVRRISGIPPSDVTDAEMEDFIQAASVILTDKLATRVDGGRLVSYAPTPTTFRIPHRYVADLNVDGVADASDIAVRFEYVDPATGAVTTSPTGTVTLSNTGDGILTTENPLPQTHRAVADYGFYSRPFDLSRARRAVAYLAAHLATLKMKAPGRITRADTQGSADTSRAITYAEMRTKYLTLFEAVLAEMGGAVA